MAVSRPVLLALLGAVLVAAAWFATSGSRSAESTSESAAPAAEQKPAAAERPATGPSKPKVAASADEAAATAQSGVPARVTRALDAGDTVVLFFFQPGASDDAATAAAVRGVRGARKVKVFNVPIAQVARYRAVISGAGVGQAPAVVIANKKGASLVEGYVDSASLEQQVADAR